MFGIGVSELLVIMVVLIIFVRPEDLPKVMRSIGKTYGKIKKFYDEIIMVKDKVLKDIEDAASIVEEPSKLISKTFTEPSVNIRPEAPKAAPTEPTPEAPNLHSSPPLQAPLTPPERSLLPEAKEETKDPLQKTETP